MCVGRSNYLPTYIYLISLLFSSGTDNEKNPQLQPLSGGRRQKQMVRIPVHYLCVVFVVSEAREDVDIGNCPFQLNTPAKQDICVAVLQKFYTRASVNIIKLTGNFCFSTETFSDNNRLFIG